MYRSAIFVHMATVKKKNIKKNLGLKVVFLNTVAYSCDIFCLRNKREYLNDSHLHDLVAMKTSE